MHCVRLPRSAVNIPPPSFGRKIHQLQWLSLAVNHPPVDGFKSFSNRFFNEMLLSPSHPQSALFSRLRLPPPGHLLQALLLSLLRSMHSIRFFSKACGYTPLLADYLALHEVTLNLHTLHSKISRFSFG